MRALILIVFAWSAIGCVAEPVVPHAEACEEQAVAWCARGGFTSSGCTTTYEQWCGVDRHEVDDTVELSCLDDISDETNTDLVPRSCQSTWAIVPPLCESRCE